MTKYYYVGTYLPTLSFQVRPEISFNELMVLLKDNLTERDYEKTIVLRRFFDILNLRSFWLGEEFDPYGELSLENINDVLINRNGLPEYVYDFLETFHSKEERIQNFPFLLVKYFQSASELKDCFLKKYLFFERDLRLIMTAFRVKKLGWDLKHEFQYENLEEELIAQLLTFQDAKHFELPQKYEGIKKIFDAFADDPLELQKAIDNYRVAEIEQMVDSADGFSRDSILAYLARFIIIQRWFELDRARGMQIVETLVKEIK